MSQFPTDLDVLSDLYGSRDSVLTARIRDLNSAMQTVQLKVGIDGSLDTNSLDYLINNFVSSIAWGGITGTLSDQTDLQSALNAKAASSHTHAIGDITPVAAARLLGRGAAGISGIMQEITVGAGLSLTGTVLSATGGFSVLVSTVDQDVTNNQNQDHSLFQFAVTAGKRYLVDMLIAISGNNTTGDFECRFAVAAGTMDGAGTLQGLAASLAVQNLSVTATAAANTADLACGTTASLDVPLSVRISFAFVPSDTTTFKFQFGNAAAAAGRTSRVMQGSVMRYKQMN